MKTITSLSLLVVLAVCLHQSLAYIRPSAFMGKWLDDYGSDEAYDKRFLPSPAIGYLDERELNEHMKRGASRCEGGKLCYGECCGRNRCCNGNTRCKHVGSPFWQSFYCD